jgi:matrixin
VVRTTRWLAAALVLLASSSCSALSTDFAAPGTRRGVDVPSKVGEVATSPLGKPALAPGGTGGYAFALTHDDGSPVTFDPCRPIHVVVRPDLEPVGGAELMQWALSQVSTATGLTFLLDGPTTETPSAQRSSYQPDRYGDRWAPVLVAWADSTDPMLGPDILGRAGPITFGSKPDKLRYVSGVAVFNGPEIDHQLHSGDEEKARAVLLHELGHLVGLAHVQDPYQVMYDTNAYPLPSYRAGDRRGLELLGMGTCFHDF